MKLRLPIVARLTLAFALSMAVLLAASGALLRVRVADELNASTDSSLRAQADVLASGVGQGVTAFGDTTGSAIAQGQVFAQILSSTGAVIESSEPLTQPLVGAAQLRSLAGPVFFERQVAGIDGQCRLYAIPVAANGRHLVIVVGLSLAGRDRILSDLVLWLGIGGPIALVLASGGGWMIARAALRPVERMRREADAISGSDRSRRLPVPATGDDVARLGSTLNLMLDRLEEAFERERRFVDYASHELRTPLSILKTELDLALSRSRSGAEMEAAVKSASQEADRLVALAEDLLVYSRSEGGRVRIHREKVDVENLLRETCGSFAARADSAGVRLEIDVLPATVEADGVRLRQALSNVIDNAIRRTPRGGAVHVKAVSDGLVISLVVDDDGPGFDADLIPVAFDPFTRGASERNSGELGAGLGLAIVKAVVEAHGGVVSINNRVEGGARVELTVPVGG